MKIYYDKEVDVLRILFNENQIQDSDETEDGIIIDFDQDRKMVGLEILSASKQMTTPMIEEFVIKPTVAQN